MVNIIIFIALQRLNQEDPIDQEAEKPAQHHVRSFSDAGRTSPEEPVGPRSFGDRDLENDGIDR